jgi:hypothetical protein
MLQEAISDAKDTVINYLDEIADMIIEKEKASEDLLNDYVNGDAYHHENHVDKDYTLLEAANILEKLNKFEETDEGLWEGLQPKKAIIAQAAYTYGNAVYYFWTKLIEEINTQNINSEMNKENIKNKIKEILEDS